MSEAADSTEKSREIRKSDPEKCKVSFGKIIPIFELDKPKPKRNKPPKKFRAIQLSIRRTCIADLEKISKIKERRRQRETSKGSASKGNTSDTEDAFEKSILNLTASVTDSNMVSIIVGYAAFSDTPSPAMVDPCKWEIWLSDRYSAHLKEKGYRPSPYNALFLQTYKIHHSQSCIWAYCLKKILWTTFEYMPQIDYILTLSSKQKEDPRLAAFFTNLIPNILLKDSLDIEEDKKEKVSPSYRMSEEEMLSPQMWMRNDLTALRDEDLTLNLSMAVREEHHPRLTVVPAETVSSQDLEEILGLEGSDKLRSIYGQYFLQELIDSSSSSSHHCLACLDPVTRTPVGFICVCDINDLETLKRNFRIEHLNRLEKDKTPRNTSSDADLEASGSFGGLWPLDTNRRHPMPKNLQRGSSILSLVSLDEPNYHSNINIIIRRLSFSKKDSMMTMKDGNILDKDIKISKWVFQHLLEMDYALEKVPLIVTREQFFDIIDLANSPSNDHDHRLDVEHSSKTPSFKSSMSGEAEEYLLKTSVDTSICSSWLPHVEHNDENSLRTEVGITISESSGYDAPKFGRLSLSDYNKNSYPYMNFNINNSCEKLLDSSSDDKSNAIYASVFFMDPKFESRGVDFLPHVFARFGERQFLALTLPRDARPPEILDQFMHVTPAHRTTLAQELYVFHKAAILQREFTVKHMTTEKDLQGVARLARRISDVPSDLPYRGCSVPKANPSKNVVLDFKYTFEYGTMPPNNMKTTIDMAHRTTTILGSGGQAGANAFVALFKDEIVGYALISDIECMPRSEALRKHFDIERLLDLKHNMCSDHGHIHHFMLSPIFTKLEKLFLQEIMRLSKKSSLFYAMYPSDSQNIDDRYSLLTCFQHFLPVAPRPTIAYPSYIDGQRSPDTYCPTQDILTVQDHPFAVYHINKRLLYAPRTTFNLRIVVVGGSTTAFSFLKTLCFKQNYFFPNLILISPEGIQRATYPETMVNNFLSSTNTYSIQELAKMSLRSRVNVIRGRVSSLDRIKKVITMEDLGSSVPYDVLVFATGRQFQIPMPAMLTRVDENGDEVYLAEEELPTQSPETLLRAGKRVYRAGAYPSNVFVMNSAFDAQTLQKRVEDLRRWKTGACVVLYGNGVEMHASLASLLHAAVAPEKVFMVISPGHEADAEGTRTDEELKIFDALTDIAVSRFVNVTYGLLMEWTWDSNYEEISTCKFLKMGNGKNQVYQEHENTKPGCNANKTDHPLIEISDVGALVCYALKEVDAAIFKTVNDAGKIIYDGGITINHNFKTPDPCIRAAGPATVYARKYYVENETQKRYSSIEIGERLAESMLKDLEDDSSLQVSDKHWQETLEPIPAFVEPLETASFLFNGLRYFHVRSPNMRYEEDELMRQVEYGRTYLGHNCVLTPRRKLVTGSAEKIETDTETRGYFSLLFDCYGRVSEILCLTRDPDAIHLLNNFKALHGVHISYLNNIQERFEEESITDLYDFLSENWIYCLFHDKFKNYQSQNYRSHISKDSINSEKIEVLRELDLNRENHLDIKTSDIIKKVKSGYQEKEKKMHSLISYLVKEKAALPMYANPNTITGREQPIVTRNYTGFMPMLNARMMNLAEDAANLTSSVKPSTPATRKSSFKSSGDKEGGINKSRNKSKTSPERSGDEMMGERQA